MTKEQYRFLKKIDADTLVSRDTLTDNELDMQQYLQQNQMLSQVMKNRTPHYYVTQHGKSEMTNFMLSYYRWWLPVIVSVAALIVSTLAFIHTT